MIKKLKDPDPQVRSRAAAILGVIGADAAIAADALKKTAANDEYWYVQWQAAESLKKIYPADKLAKMPAPAKRNVNKDVKVEKEGKFTTVSNGILELVFEDGTTSPGPFIVRRPGGENMADGSWMERVFAFAKGRSPNIKEVQWFQRLWGDALSKTNIKKVYSATDDMVDFVTVFSGDGTTMDWEFHYVLRKGQSSFYSYIVIKNVSGKDMPDSPYLYSNTGVGRLNYILGLTWDHYDYSVLSDGYKSRSQMDREPDGWFNVPVKLAAIMNATHWLPSGEVWAKHEWELYEIPSDVTGYCGRNGGFWSIYPSRDFFGDSYARYTKGGNYDNLFIPHLESKYNQAPLTIKVDKDFEKIYGPICYYINDGANVEEMWVDAKRQAQLQKGQWPYKWLDIDKYHDRGSVKGKLSISDGQSPVGAYVILANPDENKVDPQQIHIWMRNYGPYQYYLEITDPAGNFEIPNVHSGSYDFFVFKPGMIGEMRIDDIEVAKGKSASLGNITLQKHDKGRTLWQIGIPDGTVTEFKNGRNSHQWDNILRYGMDFPDDVHYVVGKSEDSVDWNNLHMATVDGKFKPVTWTIEYELDKVPAGEVVLMMVCSGNADLDVIANGKKVGDLKIAIGGHGRTMLINHSAEREFVIEKDILKVGKNTIQLTWAKGLADDPAAANKKRRDIYGHIAYDFLRLEER